MKYKIGFIGAGNMAGAVIAGILKNNREDSLYAYDIDRTKCERFGVQVIYRESILELVDSCDCIFLAVKPQIIGDVLHQISQCHQDWTRKMLVSMAAGISTGYIGDYFKSKGPAVVRIMPNTPLMLGHGSTSVCANEKTSSDQYGFVKEILSGAGYVCDIPEALMNASISINGSSPAYIFLFAKAVMEYAKSEGIDSDNALRLFSNTLIGSAHMLMESGMDPQSLIDMVTSPGGTTQEALRVFQENDFDNIIVRAMAACTKRANELGK